MWLIVLLMGHSFAAPDSVVKLDGRIVGGVETTIDEYPWQLSLLYRNQHNCGASVIGVYWAITAAHCTRGYPKNDLSIRAGSSFHATGGTIHTIDEIKDHENYNSQTYDYDIGLIKVSNPFDLGVVSAIKLPPPGSTPSAGVMASVTGWGRLGENEDIPSQLRVVQVPVISMADCKKYYDESRITSRMFCAGFDEGDKDACQGDSGGPLVINNVLHGITSWGNGCARPKYPGIYTHIGILRMWISSVADI